MVELFMNSTSLV